MHHKRKKPRTKSRNTLNFIKEAPAYWNILNHSRPRRRRDAERLAKLMRGADPDDLVWDLGNHKPHVYYW